MSENKSLTIRNLDQKVTEESLKSILELISPITQIKIFQDKDNVCIKYPFYFKSSVYFSHTFLFQKIFLAN